MKTALLLAAVLVAGLSPFAFAQPLPAPARTVEVGDISLAEPGAVVPPVLVPGPKPTAKPSDLVPVPADPAPVPSPLDNPGSFLKLVYLNVKLGNWWAAAAALLVAIVALLRSYGKKLHELIPDDNPVDKFFWFMLETKPGGWLFNILTAVAGGCGTALMVGEPVNWALVKPILMVAVTGAAMWEMGKDFMEWWKAKKAPTAAPPTPAVP